MIINQTLLDSLTAKAKMSPRLRMNLDLRNSSNDSSQRMLNAIEPGSQVPVHRHRSSSETVVILRGMIEEDFYDDEGCCIDSVKLSPGGSTLAINIPIGCWHTVRSLESGTVILEMKDGQYAPLGTDDILDSSI